jgi:hypothetical protein
VNVAVGLVEEELAGAEARSACGGERDRVAGSKESLGLGEPEEVGLVAGAEHPHREKVEVVVVRDPVAEVARVGGGGGDPEVRAEEEAGGASGGAGARICGRAFPGAPHQRPGPAGIGAQVAGISAQVGRARIPPQPVASL